jgi:hypothetical protein
MEIASHMRVTDHAFLHRNKQVTGLGWSAFVGFHENTGALYGGGVHLTCVRLKGAHKIQVDTGPQRVAIEQGSTRQGTGTENVGFSSAGSHAGSCDRQACLCAHSPGKVPAGVCVPPANQNLLETADPRNDLDCGYARAAGQFRILPKPLPVRGLGIFRDRGSCGGAQISQIVCWHNGQRTARPVGQAACRGPESGLQDAAVFPHYHQFHAQGMSPASLTGRGQKYASGHLQIGPHRNDDGDITIAKGRLDGSNHPIRIKPLVYLVFSQYHHAVKR